MTLKGQNPQIDSYLGNGDRAMNSMGNIYTVTSELSNEVMTFDFG